MLRQHPELGSIFSSTDQDLGASSRRTIPPSIDVPNEHKQGYDYEFVDLYDPNHNHNHNHNHNNNNNNTTPAMNNINAAGRVSIWEVRCCICHLVSQQPHTTRCCSQIFCRGCIQQWFDTSPSRGDNDNRAPCPTCRQAISLTNDLTFNFAAHSTVQSLRLRCPNHQSSTAATATAGCPWVGTLSSLKDHMASECQHRPCPHRCGAVFPRKSALQKHVSLNCPNAPVQCRYARHDCCPISLTSPRQLTRRQMSQHEQDYAKLHLGLATSTLDSQASRIAQLERQAFEQDALIERLTGMTLAQSEEIKATTEYVQQLQDIVQQQNEQIEQLRRGHSQPSTPRNTDALPAASRPFARSNSTPFTMQLDSTTPKRRKRTLEPSLDPSAAGLDQSSSKTHQDLAQMPPSSSATEEKPSSHAAFLGDWDY